MGLQLKDRQILPLTWSAPELPGLDGELDSGLLVFMQLCAISAEVFVVRTFPALHLSRADVIFGGKALTFDKADAKGRSIDDTVLLCDEDRREGKHKPGDLELSAAGRLNPSDSCLFGVLPVRRNKAGGRILAGLSALELWPLKV